MVDRAAAAPSLASLRHDLEEIDRAIVLLVTARVEAACEAIRCRVENGESISNPVQEARVIARARGWAEGRGVSPIAVETIFRAIVRAGKERYATWNGSSPVTPPAKTSGRTPAGAAARAKTAGGHPARIHAPT